jgi:membrane dipeptidase
MIRVFDGHNDTLQKRFEDPAWSLADRHQDGHLDLPRAREGGLAGGFFAVFPPTGVSIDAVRRHQKETPESRRVPPAPPAEPLAAMRQSFAMSAGLFALEREGSLRIVTRVEHIRQAVEDDVLAAIWHFEGAEALAGGPSDLELYWRAGVRSLGIVWSRANAYGYGVPFDFPGSPDTGPGLTIAGRQLVAECNRLGVMIDLSHLNERGFWDVAELSNAPLVATHSNAHALCASPRNLTDEQLDAIRASDGMVGLNFAVGFLREDGGRDPAMPLEVMVRHVDHLVDRLGIERVGFGSDFDGAVIPEAIGDAAGIPRLLDALAAHGYDEASLRKIAFDNWLAVLERTWH